MTNIFQEKCTELRQNFTFYTSITWNLSCNITEILIVLDNMGDTVLQNETNSRPKNIQIRYSSCDLRRFSVTIKLLKKKIGIELLNNRTSRKGLPK